ncbi:hypothetical protein [Legionella worsleiensis]|uniref:Substrate of the Dot/Icm secretion system n=1 Tax=Legionella worsleiensis TaxID=45076 RepID=A0A0W1AEI3_9GAMM|nr:hypothetical protein [Legionella worsleiensis]KTD79757.1 substrate of the Dot/Icm secretion system [Legionella worsleiensis]STY32268.1 substrate of the Dot/Icm secretion system [Legionella worsleiensis]
MALSEIMIQDVLKLQLNKVIREASYENLRLYLLERAPLLAVTQAIESELNKHSQDDIQTIIQQRNRTASDAQKTKDEHDKNIQDEIKQLADLKAQLMHTVMAEGYSMFVTQLDDVLQSSAPLNLSSNERSELERITSLMKNYLAINSQEQELNKRLDNVKNTLQQQQNKPANQKSQSESDSESDAVIRFLTFAAPIAGIIGISCGGVVFALTLAGPATVTVAAIILAAVAGILIAGVVSYLSLGALALCFTKITGNDFLFIKNKKETEGLGVDTIPELNRSIEGAQETISQIEAELVEKSNAKQQLIQEAQGITPQPKEKTMDESDTQQQVQVNAQKVNKVGRGGSPSFFNRASDSNFKSENLPANDNDGHGHDSNPSTSAGFSSSQ